MLRWVAESIAEQRLLWHLRKQQQPALYYPDDIDGSRRGGRSCGSNLASDLKKHRFWLAIDSLLMVVLGVGLLAVPGPNVLGYYFAFRVVGHFLSLPWRDAGPERRRLASRAECAADGAASGAHSRTRACGQIA